MRGLRADAGGGGGASSSASTAENSRFDSGQYSFFGKAPLEGLELGGSLADDGGLDGGGYGAGGFGAHDDGASYQLSPVGEEVHSIFCSRRRSRSSGNGRRVRTTHGDRVASLVDRSWSDVAVCNRVVQIRRRAKEEPMSPPRSYGVHVQPSLPS